MGVIRLPRLGETMEEARVVLWLRTPGERFARGDVLLEVETDKTVVEVPALSDGVLVRQLVGAGDTVALGQPIAETEGDGSVLDGALRDEPSVVTPAEAWVEDRTAALLEPLGPDARGEGRIAASPRARRIARDAGLDLARVAGTSRRGRVGAADVEALLQGEAGPALHVERFSPESGETGAPVVLLHGLFDSGRGWRDLPARLAREGRRVLVPDLPGHGRSVAQEVTLEAAEEAVLGVLPEGPVALVGHSLGAVVAARVAGRIGGRLDRLVLIAPVGLGPRMDGGFVELMAKAYTPAALSRALRGLGPGAGPLSQEALEAEFGRLDAGRAAMVALGHALVRGGVQQVDIAPVLERVRAPITAVFGLEDPIIDWRDCASLPGTTAIHLLRGAGHLPHGVRPDLVADLILGRAARAG